MKKKRDRHVVAIESSDKFMLMMCSLLEPMRSTYCMLKDSSFNFQY